MDTKELKYVVGKVKKGEPAIIRFFTSVDEYSVRCFNDEFLWLQDCVQPSKIVVMINSEGGSVLYGMSTFSIIRSCPIEVDCVIEGIAASMASIIWAAGDNLYMHDYSLLMIHNPFNSSSEIEDPSVKHTVDAFRSQLETIYIKRFGLSKEKVEEIMNGQGDADGTFFSAKEAVKAGFIPLENVIKTSKKVRDKVKNEMVGVDNTIDIRNIMSAVSAEIDENKLIEAILAIHNQNDNYLIQEEKMEKEEEKNNFDAISAQLGLAKNTQAVAIEARIKELMNAESELTRIKSELTDVKIQLEGKNAEIANISSELNGVKASLQAYKDAEEKARKAEIEAIINDAIKSGKIEASAKDVWTEMAQSNFDTVKSTLASIQAREVITEQIAKDKDNISQIEDTMKDIDAQMKAKIEEHLGIVKFDKF